VKSSKYEALRVRFDVFTTVEIQVEVFWVVTPCSVVGYRRLRGPYCLQLHTEGWYLTITLHGITTQKTEDGGSVDL
jgi:hypothetical protein